jgi:glycerol-3-phosphate acyltransferase PlsX
MAPARDPAADGSTGGDSSPRADGKVVISVDAMGGDLGPAAVVAGMAICAQSTPAIHFIVHGPEPELLRLVARRPVLAGRTTICHAEGVVTMDDKPSQVMRHGKGTSMWSTIDSVENGQAAAAVSCGNTGALMAVSMLRLRKLPGVNRPAIACLWPSKNPQGYNVMLDVGADIRADPSDLLAYAMMGAAYARDGLSVARPRVGLLNVGTEEHKGRAELKEAGDLLARHAAAGGFDYAGFIEGGDLPGSRVDVIVTDGFTGNIALKTGEGTARFVGDSLKDAFSVGIMSRFAALLALRSLRRLQMRIDPRRVNGGVFLGLNGTVVKSHGASDETGVSAAISLAARLALSAFQDRLAARVATAAQAGQDATASQVGNGNIE